MLAVRCQLFNKAVGASIEKVYRVPDGLTMEETWRHIKNYGLKHSEILISVIAIEKEV